MFKKFGLAFASVLAAAAAAGYVLYLWNPPPSVPRISPEAVTSGRPFVVKLHAQWCPYCMLTKGVWGQIEDAYADRVNLLVLDFTNQDNTAASQAEARRLGLEKFFDEYAGATGLVVVLDGRTREVRAEIAGSRDFLEYRDAIEAALKNSARPVG